MLLIRLTKQLMLLFLVSFLVVTFKVVTMASAVEEKVVDLENDTFYDTGSVNVDGSVLRCWKAGGHGHQTFMQVLQNSCNLGGYTGTFLSSKMLI